MAGETTNGAPNIRDATPADAPTIRSIHKTAFGQSAEANLVDALVSGGYVALSLVAVVDGQIAGHVLLSRLTSPPRSLALAPLAVLPAHQRLGIGSALVKVSIRRAKADGASAIFVLGNPAYYSHFGFSLDTARGFDCPYAGEHFMALMLADPPIAPAAIVYPPPFEALD